MFFRNCYHAIHIIISSFKDFKEITLITLIHAQLILAKNSRAADQRNEYTVKSFFEKVQIAK